MHTPWLSPTLYPKLQVLLVALPFALVSISILRCRRTVWSEVSKVPRRYLMGILLLMALSVVWVAYGPSITIPVYKIPPDSFITPQGAFDGRLKHRGWNFISLVDQLFERSSGFLLMNCSGALATLGLFFLAIWVGLSYRAAFIGSALFTAIPIRLFLDGPGTTGSYLLFVIWAAAFSLLLVKRPSPEVLALATFSWAAAILIRGEVFFLALFFLIAASVLLPSSERRKLPWLRISLAATLLVIPDLLIGIPYAFQGHRLLTRPDVGVHNLAANLVDFGWPFVSGRMHSAVLSLFAAIWCVTTFKRSIDSPQDRARPSHLDTLALLGGWLVVASLTYLSMWLQIYAESKQFYPKMAVLLFLYPPYLLAAAAGIEVLTQRCAPRTRGWISLTAVCGVIFLNLPHYRELHAVADRQGTPSLYNTARTLIGLDRFLVGCYRDDHLLDPISAEEVAAHSPEITRLRSDVALYLVEEVPPPHPSSKLDPCHKAIATIIERDHPPLIRSVTVENTTYRIYALPKQ
jgi:hypothetical protein